MSLRDTILDIGAFVGYPSFFIGIIGQTAFLSPVTKSYLPALIAVMISMTSMLIVYAITIFRRPWLAARPYRFCLLFAMCWFAGATIFAEILYGLGYMPPDSPAYAGSGTRVMMHIGWLSALFMIPLYIAIRRYELTGVA
ncbi:MAG: hypothetical protein V4710_14465 [Verrucomicrobiota bacterium]